MGRARCVKCSPRNSVQKPCRLCGTPVCFTCVSKKVPLWEREMFQKTSNWWCDNCSKANTKDVTPGVAQEAREYERCKICGNRQPVCRFCPACKQAALYFCIGNDCWKMDPTGSRWRCCQYIRKDTRHKSGSTKYAVPIDRDGTLRPKLSRNTTCRDEGETQNLNNHEHSPSLNLINDMLIEATRKLSAEEMKNEIAMEIINEILTNMEEDYFQDNTFLRTERSEVENSHALLGDDDEVQLECNEEEEEIYKDSRVIVDHVLERILYLETVRKRLERAEKIFEEMEQDKNNVDNSEEAYNETRSNDDEAVRQSKPAAKREEFSGKTMEHQTKHEGKTEISRDNNRTNLYHYILENSKKEENSTKPDEEKMEDLGTKAANPLEALVSTEIGESTRNALKDMVLLRQLLDPPIPKEMAYFQDITKLKRLESTEESTNELSARKQPINGQPFTSQIKKEEQKIPDAPIIFPMVKEVFRVVEALDREVAKTTMENARLRADMAQYNFECLKKHWEGLCTKK